MLINNTVNNKKYYTNPLLTKPPESKLGPQFGSQQRNTSGLVTPGANWRNVNKGVTLGTDDKGATTLNRPTNMPVAGPNPNNGAPAVATNPPVATQTPPPVAPAPQVQTPAPVAGLVAPGTFPGIVEDLRARSQTTNEQDRLRYKTEQEAMKNRGIAERAAAISDQYGAEIARVGQLGAGAVAGNLSTGSNVVGAGNAAIASQSASQRMDALAAGQAAQLEGTGQQLTAQDQITNALTNTSNVANTQQQIGVSGLSQAGGLAQPVQVAPGSTLFSPVGGEQVAGGLGGYVNYSTAEQVMGLISQYPDAGYAYNSALSPQQNLQAAQQAIQASPTYQRSTFGAPGASSFIGGAQLQAAGNLTGEAAQIQAQAGAAESNFELLLNVARQGGVNQTNVPILNTLKRNVERGTTSSEAVTTFNSVIQSVRAQYASILGGGTPTDASRSEAASQIPDDISIQALETIGRALHAEASNRIASYQNTIGGLGNQAQGGGGGGLYDF